MGLNQALKLVLELAEQNMLNDPEMQDEMLRQLNAVEAVRMHMQELEAPSPLQVIFECGSGVIHQVLSNVPTEVTVLYENTEGATDGNEYCVCSFNSYTDPSLVADILKKVSA